MANLTLAVVAINGWNRLNIAFRTVPGTYQPARREEYRAPRKMNWRNSRTRFQFPLNLADERLPSGRVPAIGSRNRRE